MLTPSSFLPAELTPLYPFLLYSMISMVLLFVDPARFRKNALVRFGIFSGVLLAAEYWLVFHVAMGGSFIILPALASSLAAIILGGVLWPILYVLGSSSVKHGGWIIATIALFLLASALVLASAIVAGSGTLLPTVVLCWSSTPWALVSYVATSYFLMRRGAAKFRFSLAQLLGFVTWFAAHCGAWRLSFILMLDEYSRLPTTPPPGCFVCTAAAGGHPRVVHGEDYRAANGTAFRVNDQLRVLKAFELLLLSISPKGHLACRWIYDRLGPRLAAMLVHPLLADVRLFRLEARRVHCARLFALGDTRQDGTDLQALQDV